MPTRSIRLAALLLITAPLLACSGSVDALPAQTNREIGLLGPGDVFEIRVYGEPEMSGIFRLSEDHGIDFPLLGRVECKNTTPGSLAAHLTEGLRRFVKDPHVSIYVKEFNSQKIYVFGHVQKPGTFKFEQGMSVVEAITLAGGFTRFANQDGTYITRIIDGNENRVQVSVEDIGEGKEPNVQLEPGDIIYVPESML